MRTKPIVNSAIIYSSKLNKYIPFSFSSSFNSTLNVMKFKFISVEKVLNFQTLGNIKIKLKFK